MWSNHPEPTQTYHVGMHPLHHSGSLRFGLVEPPRTHSKLPCRLASSSSKVVQEVLCGRTTQNSLEPTL